MKMVADIAEEWTKYANLKFNFSYDPNKPHTPTHIRITLKGNVFNSAVGTNSLDRIAREGFSMILGGIGNIQNANEVRRLVLHEFGHALGLAHEHQSPKANCQWNRPVVYNFFKTSYDWDQQMVDYNVFRRLGKDSTNYSEFDAQSIMLYFFPKELESGSCSEHNNTTLSNTDKSFINVAYPPRSRHLTVKIFILF